MKVSCPGCLVGIDHIMKNNALYLPDAAVLEGPGIESFFQRPAKMKQPVQRFGHAGGADHQRLLVVQQAPDAAPWQVKRNAKSSRKTRSTKPFSIAGVPNHQTG